MVTGFVDFMLFRALFWKNERILRELECTIKTKTYNRTSTNTLYYCMLSFMINFVSFFGICDLLFSSGMLLRINFIIIKFSFFDVFQRLNAPFRGLRPERFQVRLFLIRRFDWNPSVFTIIPYKCGGF